MERNKVTKKLQLSEKGNSRLMKLSLRSLVVASRQKRPSQAIQAAMKTKLTGCR